MTDHLHSRYAHLLARCHDAINAPMERNWRRDRRRELLSDVTGDVLEIGAGTGTNVEHYRSDTRLVLVEPARPMRRRLETKVTRPCRIVDATAEKLPFEDESFGSVVCFLVLCSVAHLPSALSEARRVLRPGGRLIFMEHVRAQGRLGRMQDLVEPVWRRIGVGCQPNREIVAAILEAGFQPEELRVFRPPAQIPLETPVASGWARV
jgi:ubiquinone/menaquinone biosynthesis C-methylase UbiE